MKVLFMTNIPSPYRVDFFNELGKYCDLTVTFEGHKATDRDRRWAYDKVTNFQAVFMKGIRTANDQFICFEAQRYLKQNWDFIILGGYTSPTAIVSILYLRLHRKTFWLEADGGFIKDIQGPKYIFKKYLISSAKGWLSTGKTTTDYFVHYGAKRDKCFEYPFTSLKYNDIQEYAKKHNTDETKKKINIPYNKIIIYVGRLIKGKGIDTLIKAAQYIDSHIGVYIIGGIPLYEFEDSIAKFHLKNVHITDFKTKGELEDYYKAADLLVLPTESDVWGLVINEAMAHGLPVITTDKCIAGLELIEDGVNGKIIPSKDSDALAIAINALINNPDLLASMREANMEKIKEYTIENMARVHMEILNANK